MDATIALAGNPNSGKTTLFNALTGARQHVGNYPGVTVEKKQGTFLVQANKITLVDLPGTYSLTAYSLEEVVARDFLVMEKPAVVVNIVDAANLERNLYLSLQFLEMGYTMCIALNMVDVAEKRGVSIDAQRLSELLGVPVVPTVARSGSGKDELMQAAVALAAKKEPVRPLVISYGEDIDNAILKMAALIEAAGFLTDRHPSRWVALKYLENDEQVRARGREENPMLAEELEQIVTRVSDHIEDTLNSYPEAVIADHRYGYIRSIVRQGVLSVRSDRDRLFVSDRIDQVLTHRWIGPVFMAGVLMLLYHFTFAFSDLPVQWMESIFGRLGLVADARLPDGLLKSLIVSGIIDGVGGVVGFVPLIMFMFFGIALIEDSGYLARVAFMLDRVFRVFGLHGNSVIAFIVSGGIAGGCAVPGVMATRTLKSPRERLATLLTVPFMNCGAKLPVFAMLVAAFFSKNEAVMMFVITVVSWAGALLIAKLLKTAVIKGPDTPFVMELPPYRFPTLKGLFIHTWARTWQYIKKAGTVVLGISILLWALMTFPSLPQSERRAFEQQRRDIMASIPSETREKIRADGPKSDLLPREKAVLERLTALDALEAEAGLRYSAAGRFGTALESISRWAGYDWRTNIALVGGFAAKEVIVSTLGTAYSLGDINPEASGSLSQSLAEHPNWRPLTALSLIVFIIFYSPCFVAVVCIVREAGSWKWGVFSMAFNTALAFMLAVVVFQVGTALGY